MQEQLTAFRVGFAPASMPPRPAKVSVYTQMLIGLWNLKFYSEK